VELVVGALAVLGFLAILTRFVTRDASGEIRLPRVVDDSIGMWALRRVTGRRLWERPVADEQPGRAIVERDSEPTRPAPGAIAVADSGHSMAGRMSGVPTGPTAARPTLHEVPPSRTPVADLRRRTRAQPPDARQPGAIGRRHRSTALGYLAAVLLVGTAAVAVAMAVGPKPGASAIASTASPADSAAVGPSEMMPSPSPISTAPSPSDVGRPDATAPEAAILSIGTSPIPGRSGLRVDVHWSITETGSGLKSQLFQRRTDSGSWVTVSLPSITTRSVSLALAKGHAYTFRIRATDKAGNVSAFATRLIHI
jgi:hypothetical protein